MNRPKTLTAAFVRTINQPGRYGDGRGSHGLSLLVRRSANGRITRTWCQRLRIGGRATSVGLGVHPIVTLAEARAKAVANRRAVEQGRDPRRSATVPTFEQALDRVIQLHRSTWKPGGGTEEDWRATVARYVPPALTARRVDQVAVADILATLTPVWANRPETARRVARRISAVMKWSMGAGHRTDNPVPAAVAALPRHDRKAQHYRAIHHSEVAQALEKVRASEASTATKLALELLTLTATRSAETRGMTWDEANLAEALWTIPATRYKTAVAFRVPLSSRAVEVLNEAHGLTGGRGLVFPSPTTRRQLSENTLGKLMAELGIAASAHGMRTSFRSWAAEVAVPREVAEQCLGHVVKGIESAYQRSDLLAQRRAVMEAWSDHVT